MQVSNELFLVDLGQISDAMKVLHALPLLFLVGLQSQANNASFDEEFRPMISVRRIPFYYRCHDDGRHGERHHGNRFSAGDLDSIVANDNKAEVNDDYWIRPHHRPVKRRILFHHGGGGSGSGGGGGGGGGPVVLPDLAQSSCPAHTEWRVLRSALDLNNTEVELFQPDAGSGQAFQWFYTVTCKNAALSRRRECPGCCIGIDHDRYKSSCRQRMTYVKAFVRRQRSTEWSWIQLDSGCSCAITPKHDEF